MSHPYTDGLLLFSYLPADGLQLSIYPCADDLRMSSSALLLFPIVTVYRDLVIPIVYDGMFSYSQFIDGVSVQLSPVYWWHISVQLFPVYW